ncbi:GNAT family N-acetyltransferase, partial [Streptomyces sp. NPDC047726]
MTRPTRKAGPFERENRAYFSASIPDRGDDYFSGFDVRH